MVGRTQKGGDSSVTEAVKHATVGGETIAGNASTSWIYPGEASSVTFNASGDCKAEMRGAGGDGLAATEYRKLSGTVLGWGIYNHSGGGTAMGVGNIMPHEFRITDTSGSENTVTWRINYSSYGDEEGKV